MNTSNKTMSTPYEYEVIMERVREVLGKIPGEAQRKTAELAIVPLVATKSQALKEFRKLSRDPMREIFARLGDKWSFLLLLVLRAGPFRNIVLHQLVNVVSGDTFLSQRMLALKLRHLERDGLLRRVTLNTVPPGAEYSLTELGVSLLKTTDVLMEWVRQHHQDISASQAAFDASNPTLTKK